MRKQPSQTVVLSPGSGSCGIVCSQTHSIGRRSCSTIHFLESTEPQPVSKRQPPADSKAVGRAQERRRVVLVIIRRHRFEGSIGLRRRVSRAKWAGIQVGARDLQHHASLLRIRSAAVGDSRGQGVGPALRAGRDGGEQRLRCLTARLRGLLSLLGFLCLLGLLRRWHLSAQHGPQSAVQKVRVGVDVGVRRPQPCRRRSRTRAPSPPIARRRRRFRRELFAATVGVRPRGEMWAVRCWTHRSSRSR